MHIEESTTNKSATFANFYVKQHEKPCVNSKSGEEWERKRHTHPMAIDKSHKKENLIPFTKCLILFFTSNCILFQVHRKIGICWQFFNYHLVNSFFFSLFFVVFALLYRKCHQCSRATEHSKWKWNKCESVTSFTPHDHQLKLYRWLYFFSFLSEHNKQANCAKRSKINLNKM